MNSLFKLLNAADQAEPTYDTRKIGRDNVKGLTVSTAWTVDQGYETAILDVVGTHPVERYPDIKDAQQGHIKWVEEALTVVQVVKLGYDDLVDDKVITLVRSIGDESELDCE